MPKASPELLEKMRQAHRENLAEMEKAFMRTVCFETAYVEVVKTEDGIRLRCKP